MSLVDAAIDTNLKRILYRDFVLNEVWVREERRVWEYYQGEPKSSGVCPTVFEAIEAVDAWYERETA